MRLSKTTITPTKNITRNADTVNSRLLVQGGFVRQLMAGSYIYLPFGLRVLNKIRNIIRLEMDALGGQEISMPALHPAKNWKATGGWDSIDVLFKIKSRTGKDYALGQSHEEVATPLMKEFINSYKDLPMAIYQINWKFRDELRAKSGILRGREFEMKDMYSFHETQADFEKFYNSVKLAYIRAYNKLGLKAKATEASGGNFSNKISYEFMVLTSAGEDDILYCDKCDYCVNDENTSLNGNNKCPKCKQGMLVEAVASEVGNVFDLGKKYAENFGLTYIGRDGQPHYPIMGCYGWGTTRTMGVIVEHFNDEKGILWPKSVAPFDVHLIAVRGAEKQGEELYKFLQKEKIEVLFDDRDGISAGEKFAGADLIGCPYRLVVSPKIGEGKIELKERSSESIEITSLSGLKQIISI